MDKIRIYRVEDAETGVGPYRDNDLGWAMSDAHLRDPDHPTPPEDGLSSWDWEKNCFFAFDTHVEALKWFDGFLPRLRDAGFTVTVYESNKEDPYILRGTRQVLFHSKDFDMVEQIPFDTAHSFL